MNFAAYVESKRFPTKLPIAFQMSMNKQNAVFDNIVFFKKKILNCSWYEIKQAEMTSQWISHLNHNTLYNINCNMFIQSKCSNTPKHLCVIINRIRTNWWIDFIIRSLTKYHYFCVFKFFLLCKKVAYRNYNNFQKIIIDRIETYFNNIINFKQKSRNSLNNNK